MKAFKIPLEAQNEILIFIVLHAHLKVVARKISFSFAQ